MDPEIFKANLKGLLATKGMSQRELADRCSLGYQWVRRVCSRGLTRVEDRNRQQLEAICTLLEVTPTERLWSPDLLAGTEEAKWYGGKVEEILSVTRSLIYFEVFESISKSSITELKHSIDQIYSELQQNDEILTQRHEASLKWQRRWKEPVPARASDESEQIEVATEYTTKLRQVFRKHSIANNKRLRVVANTIDTLYFEKQANRVVTILRDRQRSRCETWLVFFGDRQPLESSVAVALAMFPEDQVLNWLECHPAPDNPSVGTLSDLNLIREWMSEPDSKECNKSSTAGGNVAFET